MHPKLEPVEPAAALYHRAPVVDLVVLDLKGLRVAVHNKDDVLVAAISEPLEGNALPGCELAAAGGYVYWTDPTRESTATRARCC